MRISAGSAKGVRLAVPPGARPPPERVRQAIFSSLGDWIAGCRVLDLFCGSGAYGLEALSRGAADATFVDSDARAIAAVRANAEAAGFTIGTTLVRSPVRRFLQRSGRHGPYRLVFADPPYARPADAARLLADIGPFVQDGGRVVLEARWGPSDPFTGEDLVVEADRRYGDTRVLTYVRLGRLGDA